MTLWELLQFAQGVGEREWETASFLAALIYNAHCAKKGRGKKPADFNPYRIAENKKKTRASFDEFARALPNGEKIIG